MEEDHPSLDGSVKQAANRTSSGAEDVSQELDLFNLKYQRLMEALRSRIAEVGAQNEEDPAIQVGQISSYKNIQLEPRPEPCTHTPSLGAIRYCLLAMVLGRDPLPRSGVPRCVWLCVRGIRKQTRPTHCSQLSHQGNFGSIFVEGNNRNIDSGVAQ